jgi:two-component system chemotaxis response regulator CheY
MNVSSACDGAAALEFLNSHQPPDLVLLDMRMPGIDGPTLVDAIRQDQRLGGVRVFAVSGSARSEYPAAALAVDGWFSKPVRIDALVHAAKLNREASNA